MVQFQLFKVAVGAACDGRITQSQKLVKEEKIREHSGKISPVFLSPLRMCRIYLSIEVDFTLLRHVKSRQQFNESRLPTPVSSRNENQFAPGETRIDRAERKILQISLVPIRMCDCFELQRLPVLTHIGIRSLVGGRVFLRGKLKTELLHVLHRHVGPGQIGRHIHDDLQRHHDVEQSKRAAGKRLATQAARCRQCQQHQSHHDKHQRLPPGGRCRINLHRGLIVVPDRRRGSVEQICKKRLAPLSMQFQLF